MTTKDGSSSGSSGGGGGGGGGGSLVYDRTTGTWVEPKTQPQKNALQVAINTKQVAPMPVAQSAAPKDAFLGSTSGGGSLVSQGNGSAVDTSTGSSVSLPRPAAHESTPSTTKYLPSATAKPEPAQTIVSAARPATSTPSPISKPSSGGGGGGGGGGSGSVPTTVNQKPPENVKPKPDGAEGTTVNAGPRSDFSVVLAGQVGRRPDRSPARSNNFVSIVGRAGGLGRKTSEAKRTLIGGA